MKKQEAKRRRSWVALLRSPLNSRSAVAPDDRPRNATQVIVAKGHCRSKLLLGPLVHLVISADNRRSYARTSRCSVLGDITKGIAKGQRRLDAELFR